MSTVKKYACWVCGADHEGEEVSTKLPNGVNVPSCTECKSIQDKYPKIFAWVSRLVQRHDAVP